MRSVLLGFVAAGAMFLVGCSSSLPGSGVAKTETRTVADFSAIVLKGQGELDITVGSPTAFEVTADDNLIGLIETSVNDGRLEISLKQRIAPRVPIKFKISAAALKLLHIDGAGDARITGVEGDALDLAIHGAGSIRAAGVAKRLTASIAGMGNLNLDDLKADDATLKISGAGHIDASVQDMLDASIAGTGDIRYRGDPKVHKSVSGAGSISKK